MGMVTSASPVFPMILLHSRSDGDHGVSFHLKVSCDKAACDLWCPAAAIAASCFFFGAQDHSPLLEIAIGDEVHHLWPGSFKKDTLIMSQKPNCFELTGADDDWTSCGRPPGGLSSSVSSPCLRTSRIRLKWAPWKYFCMPRGAQD